MKRKIQGLKRYISSKEKLELAKLKVKYADLLAIKFYEASEKERRDKWTWLYNTVDGKRFRLLQYKRAIHNISRRLTKPETIGRDFDQHTIEIYEIELKAPRGFNVFTLDRSEIQAKIFSLWRDTTAGNNWAELKRNIAMMQRGKLRRCKIEARAKSRIFTYKKKWEETASFGFNTFGLKGKKKAPVDTRKFSVLRQGGKARNHVKRGN